MKTNTDQTSGHLNLVQLIGLSSAAPATRSASPSDRIVCIDRLEPIDLIESDRRGSPTDRIDRIKTGYSSDNSGPQNETNNLKTNHMDATRPENKAEKLISGRRPRNRIRQLIPNDQKNWCGGKTRLM
jgi:hypothetical protein